MRSTFHRDNYGDKESDAAEAATVVAQMCGPYGEMTAANKTKQKQGISVIGDPQ